MGAHLVTEKLSLLHALPISLAWTHGHNGKWIKASLLLGITASIKPFRLIFLPYLLLNRQVKAVGIFVSVFMANFVIGVAIFGIETHIAWLQCLAEIDWHGMVMNASLRGILARALAESAMFVPLLHAEFLILPLWILLAVFIAGVAFWTMTHDNSTSATDRAFAILLLSAILISPLGWIYYLFLLLGPLTALSSRWNDRLHIRTSQKYSRQNTARTLFLLAGISGLFMPLMGIPLLQGNALTTVTLGSIYCWSTLMLWGYLVIDWAIDNHWSTKPAS